MMPPRNAKRAPAPKHRGKGNNKSNGTPPTQFQYPSQLPPHTTRRSSSSSASTAAASRPPPRRLSKVLVSANPVPPSVASASANMNARNFSYPSATAAASSSLAPPQPSQGFTYLSPEVLAASRFPSSSASPSSLISPAATSAGRSTFPNYSAESPSASSYPSARPPSTPATAATAAAHTAQESSLARLRALAGTASLMLAAKTPPSPNFQRNEESPLHLLQSPRSEREATADSSPPSTPYTPELVRRLAALNGVPYEQAMGVVHTDRLKRQRAAAAGAEEEPKQPVSRSFGYPSLLHNSAEEEEEEERERLRRLRTQASATTAAAANAAPSASATTIGTTTASTGFQYLTQSKRFENEEEEEVGRTSAPDTNHTAPERKPATWSYPSSSSSSAAVMSALDRLRAASRGSSRLVSPPVSPIPDTLAAASTYPSLTPATKTAPSMSAIGGASLTPSPETAPLSVTERLAQLRRRASASPTVQPLLPGGGPTSAPSAPEGYFMNLERMQVGHGSSSGTDSRAAPSGAANRNAGASISPAQRSLPVPPTSVDGVADGEAESLNALDAYLRRYRAEAAQSLLQTGPTSPSHVNPVESPSLTEVSAPAGGAGRGTGKRPTRRSQRRLSAAAAKKESAVATLVKGRKSGQRATMGESLDLSSSHRNTTSAQVVNRLRQLATAPMPVGETASTTGNDHAGASAHEQQQQQQQLPPSWSSASPFAALASPNLYGMLNRAARDQEGSNGGPHTAPAAEGASSLTTASNNGSNSMNTTSATAPATFNYPSAQPDLRRLPAFSARRTTRDRALPSTSQCIVFDTSALLDSEPAVLNLLLERAYIGIPFKVLDELDSMHKGLVSSSGGGADARAPFASAAMPSNSSSSGTGGVAHDREWRRRRAHELRNWIGACMTRHNPHLLLQKRSEVIEEYDRHTANNDDEILGYAVYLRRHREKVIFVTEDKFLRIKAAAEIGKAYAYNDVRQMMGMPPPSLSQSTKTKPIAVHRLRRKR